MLRLLLVIGAIGTAKSYVYQQDWDFPNQQIQADDRQLAAAAGGIGGFVNLLLSGFGLVSRLTLHQRTALFVVFTAQVLPGVRKNLCKGPSLAFRTTAIILDLPKNEISAFLDTKCGDLSDKTSVITIIWL